ncbi:FAD/NAD-P-binding domain-containing protein [Mycena amicta]|nr:FAD/NAD-P-binding domain-containing protein [Mycena amicta]
MHVDHGAISSSWLSQFSTALASQRPAAIAACFLPDGWLRDVLVFTWTNRSLEGRDKIVGYLEPTLGRAGIRQVALDDRPHRCSEYKQQTGIVAAGFTFETAVGPGEGYVQLLATPAGEWLAVAVFMVLVDIHGHEEAGAEEGVYGGHTLAWKDVARERREKIEADPHVLIIGGGQTGLNVAARFKQMNIPALVVEKNARVGDNWRERYPTLTLHSIKTHSSMLYQPFHGNWPVFTPRDKLAQWLEQYPDTHDLVVWTSSRPLPTPHYDAVSKRWTVVVDRAGTHVTLHPNHLIVAAGTLGGPRYPVIRDPSLFHGVTLHAAHYHGGAPFAGKRVIVIGAANSAADVCQDLVFHKAQSVTMVQRSSTCVVSAHTAQLQMRGIWPEEVPVEDSDFKSQATPLTLMKRWLAKMEGAMWESEKETHRGLRQAGMKLNMGIDGSGPFPLQFERFGGFWLDVGCAALIRDGKVKIKQGVEAARFTEDSLVFTDGSALPADVVIYATAYESIRDNMRALFSDAVIDKTSPLWGLDEEGELRGCYRESGHPGLWFAAGNFAVSRFYSKQLALEIKALELGLISQT